jgi:hypothetical protein
MIRVEEFITDQDVSPFRRWFDDLDNQAAAWRRQQSDIQTALRHWRAYKARKAVGKRK